LFETGIIDRKKAADLLGMHIDPSDAAANPRYVPVNLMTVEHSLHLEEGARLANEMQQKSIETAQKTLDGMVPAPEPTAATGSTEAEPPSGRMDKSPSQSGIDKRLRNANASIQWSFDHTINSLAQYEARVLAQKRESRPDDYDAAVAEFYAENSKFRNMLAEQVLKFRDVVESPEAVDSFVDSWLSNRSKPETLILFPEVPEGAEQ
jgi:hypothetical protein